jgi:translocation and assembly module TamB
MSRARGIALSVAVAVGVAALLIVGALLIITQTDWGREQVRRIVLEQLDDALDGEVEIGRIEGNLLRRIRLVDVTIVDTQGRPFVRADTISTRFSLRSLVRQRIILTNTRLVNAEVVLDKLPGEDWNYVRIFRMEPEPEVIDPPRRPTWGDWIELHDAELVNSRLTVRTAWDAPEDLTPAERERALQKALAGETRENIVEVPGGYQNVMDFRELNAALPFVRLAHPDRDAIPIEVARFSGIVQPFRPPAAVVNDLAGSLRIARDSLFFNDVQAVLPGSRVAGEGVYALDAGDLFLRLNGAPAAFADFRWLYPPLPEEGGGSLRLTLHMRSLATRIIGEDMDLRVGESALAGRIDLTVGDTLRLQDTELRFSQVDTRLIEQVVPDLDMPRQGRLTGELTLAGTAEAMRVDGDVTFADYTAGTSRVIAQGQLGIEEEVRFRDLRLRFQPLQAELVRAFVPQLPMRGTITGYANLTGVATGGPLQLESDLTLRDPRAGLSRVRAVGGVDTRDELRLQNLRLSFDPLRVDLLRDELPELPRGGTLAGQVRLHGVPRRLLQVDGDLALTDPRTGVSRVGATGGLALADELGFRNLRVRFDPLQADFVRPWVPQLPAGSTLRGQALLDGVPERRLQVDGEVALQDPATGLSRLAATGGIRTAEELRFDDLRLRFDPLQVELLRDYVPALPAGAELPANATLAGPLRLHGSPAALLQLEGDLTLRDPQTGVSRIAAAGAVELEDELVFRDLFVRADPLQLDLVRPWLPELPAGATLQGQALLDGAPERRLRLDADLALDDPATGLSRVAAVGGIRTAEELRFDGLRLRFDPLQTDLLREQFPDLPPGGSLVGNLRLDGAPERMLQVNAQLAHHDPQLGVSQVAATGGIGVADQLRFADLDLRFDPLRLELVRAVVPEVPLGGVLQGTATLDGSPETRLSFRANLQHQDAGEHSHVVGQGQVVTGPAGWAAVDVQLQPLSLVTVGRFVPEAGLRGSVAGHLQAQGDMSNLALQTDLRLPDGGALAGSGTLDLAAEQTGYDLDLRMRDFNLAAVTARAPAATDLTGAAAARGRGFEPATMSATLRADLVGSEVDGVAADEVRLRLAIDRGLAQVDQAVVRIGTAEAEAQGSFGLVAGRHGELAYRVSVESLHDFAPWIPGADTAVVVPRPAPLDGAPEAPPTVFAFEPPPAPAERTVGVTRVRYPGIPRDRARQVTPLDIPLARQERDTEPAREPAEPVRVTALPADSLAGSLRAVGRLRGNVERFDLEGRAEVEELVFQGNYIGSGRAEYALADVGTPQFDANLDAELESVRAQGFEFESVAVRGHYVGDRFGTGHVVVAARQDEDTDLRADVQFALSLERSELRLDDLELRFDTVTWQSTQPGLVRWGGAAVEVETLELTSNIGGRIYLDGRLPVEGAGDLEVVIDDLEIGHVVALLQDEREAAGRLSLAARIQGTQRNPRFQGEATLLHAVLDGRPWPETHTTFAYENLELTADALLVHEGRVLTEAEARLPINLALAGDVEQRLLDGPLAVDVRADSLPLDILPALTDQLEDLQGRIVANLTVRGTFDDPDLQGVVDVDLASFHLVPTGIRYERIAGTLRLQNDQVTVDSLVAWNGGPIRVTGTIALPELTEPVFDLVVVGRETWVIDTGDARLMVDADLAVTGTLEAIEVAGDVRTRRGVIYIPEMADFGGGNIVSLDDPKTFERVDTLLRVERDLVVERSPLLENLNLDLTVQVDRDVWLRSTEANVEIYTPAEVGPLHVRMNGGPDALALDGVINTDRGEVEFMSRRFALTRGAMTFAGEPEFNPFIQLAAEHEVRLPGREGFSIRVVLDGTVDDLALTLESTAQPPISQTDLMSYLAFGRQASSLLQFQGSGLSGTGTASGDLVGNVAALATQQLATVAVEALVNDLERDLARELGLDVFRISPADLPAELFTGSYLDVLRGTEIEAGSYLTRRVFVAGQLRPTFPQPGVRVEYRLPLEIQWTVAWQPRFLPAEPTLTDRNPERASIFGSFLFRLWRF